MSRIFVHYNNSHIAHSFEPGDRLLDLLQKWGCSVGAPCGGHGLCGKCKVTLKVGDELREVRACSTLLTEDCEVFLPDDSREPLWKSEQKAENTGGGREGFGVAVDLGSTTVAVSLFDLNSGKEIGSTSRWNILKSYGADVISRIGYCMEHADGLDRLCREQQAQILQMLSFLCAENALPKEEIREGFLAGNTVMEHIFAKISPASIAVAPYLPLSYFTAGEAVILEGIPFYLSPCVAGYLGGDITAGLLAAKVCDSEKTSLFIDVGTNGEIVLGNKNGLTSCTVASGPAFEGAGISCGMPALCGAIYRVFPQAGHLGFEVLGGGEAKGICGSGLLDLLACLLDLGYLDESGSLRGNREDRFYLTDSVYISQRDIRQLQLAKAAIAAGITRLTETKKISFGDIDQLYLSGGFGSGIRSESAVRIGMLPEELADKVILLGNTSLSGAAQALLAPSKRRELPEIKKKCAYLELSSDIGFNDRFVEAMSFPEQKGK